jgi:hypothetical protein
MSAGTDVLDPLGPKIRSNTGANAAKGGRAFDRAHRCHLRRRGSEAKGGHPCFGEPCLRSSDSWCWESG